MTEQTISRLLLESGLVHGVWCLVGGVGLITYSLFSLPNPAFFGRYIFLPVPSYPTVFSSLPICPFSSYTASPYPKRRKGIFLILLLLIATLSRRARRPFVASAWQLISNYDLLSLNTQEWPVFTIFFILVLHHHNFKFDIITDLSQQDAVATVISIPP
jgi:hypothetical protein